MKFSIQHYTEDQGLIDEVLPLLNAWGLEVLPKSRFGIRTTAFLNLWKNNTLVIFLAKDPDTSAIHGFQIWWVYDPIFILDKKAVSGPIYIKPEHRGSFAKEFVEYGINAVRILGAKEVVLDWPVTLAPISHACDYFKGEVVAHHIQLKD